MNNEIQDKDYKPLTPFKGWVLENFPFIEADFDAITNYQLLCKITEYLNNVIYNQNQVEDLGTELVNGYNSLLDYVNNYFSNLDITTEINNKLDEMASTGVLTNLIKGYVDPIYEAYETSINGRVTSYEETVNSQLTTMNNKVNAVYSNSPVPVASTDGMVDTSKIYVNTSDGKWYYYNGSVWTVGGNFQSSGIGENGVKTFNLDTQIITKLNTLGDEQNSLITNNQSISYTDTSNHMYIYQNDSEHTLTLEAGRYMLITKLKVDQLTSGATIKFRQGGRYKIGSGNVGNNMVTENIHDATFTYEELGTYKYCWGTVNASDTIGSFRPLVVFVNQSQTNPIEGEFYVDKFWLFKVDSNTDAFYNNILDRIDFYAYQQSYPILNLSVYDRKMITGNVTSETIAEVYDYIDNEVADIEAQLKYMPDYMTTYINGIIEDFEADDKELSFIFQTDHHINDLSYMKQPVINAIKSSNVLMHNLPLALNLFGGDYVGNGSSTTKEEYSNFMRIFNKEIENQSDALLLRGNHDINQMNVDSSEHLSDTEIFNIIGKKYIVNKANIKTNNNIPNPMYGYIDYDFQKIRLVFVNTSDGYDQGIKIGMGNMNTTQLQWLADNAFTLPSGKTDYQVICVGHYPVVDFSDGSEVEDGRLNGFKLLLKAFINGQNLSYTAWGNNYKVVKDFSVQGPKTLICYLCGHTHYDADYLTEDGLLQIATTNAGYYNKTEDTGTTDELAYDIVKIDPLNKKIKFQRVGNGSDREFDY